jgi:xylose dehydrogenase (NAD/NADP)
VGLGLGLLSTARINRAILHGASLTDHVDVLAVASRDGTRAEAYARQHDLERAHASYEALLTDPDVDAVYIPLPNSLHVEATLRALDAGKHVLVEKPLTRRRAEAERVFDAAERAGLVVMEGFMYRHHPQTKRLADLVHGGAIGELRVVRAAFTFTITGDTDVRLSAELDGGSLMDVGCYCVSMTRLLAGEPEAFAGFQTLGPSGVDIRFAGAMRHPGGVLSHFHCGFDSPLSQDVVAVGSEGSAIVRAAWVINEPVIELHRGGDEVERIEIEPLDRYMLQLENFAAAVAGEQEPLLGRDDAVGQACALESLYAAAENPSAGLSS